MLDLLDALPGIRDYIERKVKLGEWFFEYYSCLDEEAKSLQVQYPAVITG